MKVAGEIPADRRLRVVHVITSLGPGGAERQVELLLANTANDASVVCLYFQGIVGDRIVEQGGRVTVLGMAGIAKLTAVVRLARLLRRRRADVVHVHLLSAQLFGILAARLARVPVVASTEHSLMEDTIEGRPHRRWLRMVHVGLHRMTDGVVAVSETTRQRLARWGVSGATVEVIDNGVDFASTRYDGAARARARLALGVPVDSPTIGAVGRLVGIKRFDVLVRAVSPLLAAGDAHLVIVGEGPLAGDLATLAAELAPAGRVHLPGARPDVAEILNAFDVMVSPSRDETFGVAILEAIGNGLPTIYEQCPAIDDAGIAAPGAVKIDSRGDDGRERLRDAVEAQLAAAGSGRLPVPLQVVERYGAERLGRAYDELHARLFSGAPSAEPAGAPIPKLRLVTDA